MYGFMLSKTNKYVVHGKKKKKNPESPVVKDFMYDCSVTNSSVVVENNMRKDSISTLSEWTGEHSRQYLESPSSEDVMKDFMYDCSSVTNSSVVKNNMRMDSISTLSGWSGEHSLQYLESSYSEEEAVCTVYGQGRENEGIKGKEANVSEPKKPQERKGDVNMKLWERKFDEEERKQIMNNDFDTEEVWDDDVHNLEGGKTNQIVS